MNKYFLILKGNNKELAKLEFEILYKTYFEEEIILKEEKNVIYSFETKKQITKETEFLSRLTYTNYIGFFLDFYENYEDYKENITRINIKKYQGLSFKMRIKKSRLGQKINLTDKELATPIWKNLENPKVSIENPDVELNCLFIEEKTGFYLIEKIYENQKDYLRRMPQLRPIKMPYTLKSDMARASINLLGLKSGIVLDPFAGIGGLLLEAYDMNFKIIGNDINYNDLEYFKENFEYFYPGSTNNGKIIRTLADSQTQYLQNNSIDGIVSDIPYGKSSRKLGSDLYEKFLQSAKNYLKKNKKMIIIYANFVEFKNLAEKYFTIENEVDEYINKSMTRHILILKNNK